jgi:hypothetical protein
VNPIINDNTNLFQSSFWANLKDFDTRKFAVLPPIHLVNR